jgi:hypothetical protein
MLLDSSRALQTGALKFCINEHLLHSLPARTLDVEGTRPLDPASSVALTSTEIATGEARSLQFLDGIPNSQQTGWYSSPEYLVNCNHQDGNYRIYSLSQSQWMSTGMELEGKNPKIYLSTKKIISHAQPQYYPNYFIFLTEEESIQTMLIHKKGEKTSIRLSQFFRLNRVLTLAKIKPRGKIQSIVAHPTLPVVFVLYSQGTILVRIILKHFSCRLFVYNVFTSFSRHFPSKRIIVTSPVLPMDKQIEITNKARKEKPTTKTTTTMKPLHRTSPRQNSNSRL